MATSSFVHASDPVLQRIEESGRMVIGWAAAPPFAFKDQDGHVTGYSVELCKEVAATVGEALGTPVEVEFKEVAPPWIPAIIGGDVDIICAATTYLLSRREEVSFSLITYVTGADFLMPADSDASTIQDLSGGIVGVVPDTSTAKVLQELMQTHDLQFELLSMGTSKEGIEAIPAGRIDAYFADRAIIESHLGVRRYKDSFRFIGQFFSYEPYALMVPREASEFLRLVDATLARLFRSNEIMDYFDNWFETSNGESEELILRALFRIQELPE